MVVSKCLAQKHKSAYLHVLKLGSKARPAGWQTDALTSSAMAHAVSTYPGFPSPSFNLSEETYMYMFDLACPHRSLALE